MAKSALRISVQHLDHPALLWYLAAVMVGSVAWLFLTLYRALR